MLHEREHYETAYAISILAWEETNKAGLLLLHYVEKRDLAEDDYHRIFRGHQGRLGGYSEYQHVLPSTSTSSPATDALLDATTRKAIEELDREKQELGFYVDFSKRTRRWTSPRDFKQALSQLDPDFVAKSPGLLIDQHLMSTFYATNSIHVCARIQRRIEEIQLSMQH
jgi:AbiV family abortive infection protein